MKERLFQATDNKCHTGATDDYEWYDPGAVTTKAGKLVITMTEEPIHGESFSSG